MEARSLFGLAFVELLITMGRRAASPSSRALPAERVPRTAGPKNFRFCAASSPSGTGAHRPGCDRQSGTLLGVTLWESEETMQASEQEADRLREESAEASNQTVAHVER